MKHIKVPKQNEIDETEIGKLESRNKLELLEVNNDKNGQAQPLIFVPDIE